MDLMNIAEHVTKMLVSGAALYGGSQLFKWAWKRIDAYAAKLKNQYHNKALISPRAHERMTRMRDFTLVLCFVSMLYLQVRATGDVLQAWDVVALCTWTWCLLTTLLHIAQRK